MKSNRRTAEVENKSTQPKIGLIQTPLFAFFSKDLYAGVTTSWKGTGILYLFLLVLMSWTVTCLSVAYAVSTAVHNVEVRNFCQKIPAMNFESGKLSIDKPLPYTIQDDKAGTTLAVFVKEHKSMELSETDPPIVITPEYMLVRDQKGQPLNFADLEKALPGLKFSGADIMAVMENTPTILSGIVFTVGLLPIFIGHLLVLLAYGGIEMLLASSMEARINYSTALRLAAVAMTPTVLLSTILTAVAAMPLSHSPVHAVLPQWWWISIIMSVGFLFLAAKGAQSANLAASSVGSEFPPGT
jgi:hypothetical protein